MQARRSWLAALAAFVAVTSGGPASGAPRPRGVVVRGSAAHKLQGAPDRSYYTAKHEQTVTFELEGPNVLVIDVQPHRGTEPSSGARFAATLDGKDLAWVDVSCKPTATRLAPDPSPKDACAAVERRFEVSKGKHRLALRLVVGESAALIPRVESVIAKASDDLDLAPIVSNAPEAGSRTEPSKPVAIATAPAKNDGELDLAPIAGAAAPRGSPATSGAPSAAASAPGATPPATTPRVVAQQPSSPPPARADEPPPTAKPTAPVSPVAGPTPSPSSHTIDAAPTATGPRTQVAARSDLDLSPKAPGAQFSFGFLSKPVVWGPAALGAVGLGVAGYFGMQSRSSFDSAAKPTASQLGRKDLNDKGVTQAKTANVLFGVGGVALGAAAVMAVLEIVSGPSDAQGGL